MFDILVCWLGLIHIVLSSLIFMVCLILFVMSCSRLVYVQDGVCGLHLHIFVCLHVVVQWNILCLVYVLPTPLHCSLPLPFPFTTPCPFHSPSHTRCCSDHEHMRFRVGEMYCMHSCLSRDAVVMPCTWCGHHACTCARCGRHVYMHMYSVWRLPFGQLNSALIKSMCSFALKVCWVVM